MIPMKKALILAAGIGKRLGDLTKDIPKCLLKIDKDNVLIDYSLETLKEVEINEIIFVTGFAEDKLKEHVLKKWKNKFDFKFIFNNKYADYNNIYSAYLAKDIWDDETALLNSDIIFASNIFSNLQQRTNSLEAGARASYLVIDDTRKLSSEDMKVTINEYGHINKINKNLNIETALGEYIGIICLRGLERIKFLESLEKNVKVGKLDLYYEDALAHVLDEITVLPCSTDGKRWTEVDTVEDYKLAIKLASDFEKMQSI